MWSLYIIYQGTNADYNNGNLKYELATYMNKLVASVAT